MTDAPQRDPNKTQSSSLAEGTIGIEQIDTERLSSGSMITVDYERYAHFLDSSNASEAEKREFAQLIWNIVFSIASLGFDLHPVQAVQKICGKTAFSTAARRKAPQQVLD